MAVTTKNLSTFRSESRYSGALVEKLPCQQDRSMWDLQTLEFRINCDMYTSYSGDVGMLLSRVGQLKIVKLKSSRLS